jgi:hypothetical protein
MLRNNTSQWHIVLPTVIYTLRVKVHSILKKTPYKLLYGVPPPTSDSLAALGRGLTVQSFNTCTEAHQNLGEHQLYLCEHLLSNGRAFVFQPKDLVMIEKIIQPSSDPIVMKIFIGAWLNFHFEPTSGRSVQIFNQRLTLLLQCHP